MELLNEIFAALQAGADRLIDAAIPIMSAYAVYLVARARTTLLSGVPAWLHALVAGAIEQALMPIVTNAVKAAEEYGARLVQDGIARAKARISQEKLAYARQYVLDRVPDWLVSDERLGKMIDAALVEIGRGATKGITVGVEVIEGKLSQIPPPPAA